MDSVVMRWVEGWGKGARIEITRKKRFPHGNVRIATIDRQRHVGAPSHRPAFDRPNAMLKTVRTGMTITMKGNHQSPSLIS